MDVLGFVDRQKASFKNGTETREFERFYKVAKCEGDALNVRQTLVYNSSWRTRIFTDNIVLAYPLRNDRTESVIGTVARCVSKYQLGMAKEGFFMRGGLAFDSLFIDDYCVYGKALIDAHEIEQSVAIYPRIVASDTARKHIEEHFGYYREPQDSPPNRFFLLDADGQVFLNYLEYCFTPIQSDEKPDLEALQLHRINIERNLIDFSGQSRIWVKYSWLASYHNFMVNQWREKACLDHSYMVTKKLYRGEPARLCPTIIPKRR